MFPNKRLSSTHNTSAKFPLMHANKQQLRKKRRCIQCSSAILAKHHLHTILYKTKDRKRKDLLAVKIFNFLLPKGTQI